MPKLPPLSVDQKPKVRYKNAGKLKGKVKRDGTKKPGERLDTTIARKYKEEAAAKALPPPVEAAPPPRRRGVTGDYKPEFADQALKAAKLGATLSDLAELFEVSERTVRRWTLQHEDFCQAVKIGGEFASDRVEASLYRKAVGFEFDSEKLFYNKELDSVHRAKVREVVHPDVGAAQFWLKNKRPDQWRDRQESVNLNVTMEVAFDQFIRELQFSKGQAIDVEATPVEQKSLPEAAE